MGGYGYAICECLFAISEYLDRYRFFIIHVIFDIANIFIRLPLPLQFAVRDPDVFGIVSDLLVGHIDAVCIRKHL